MRRADITPGSEPSMPIWSGVPPISLRVRVRVRVMVRVRARARADKSFLLRRSHSGWR